MVIELKKNADVFDLIEQMHIHFGMHLDQGMILADLFTTENCCQSSKLVWDYLRTLNYRADEAKQIIQTPYRLTRTQTGDCKSFSIFAASIMAALGNPVRFVYTCNAPDGMWHVYTQVKCGCGIRTIDGTINEYNFEVPAKNKYIGEWMQ